MIREDFLLRLIRQLLVQLLGSRAQREALALDGALDALDALGRRSLGLDGSLLARLPVPGLLSLFTGPDGLDVGKTASAGFLLLERGSLLAARGQETEGEGLRTTGLALLDAALAASEGELRTELEAARRAYEGRDDEARGSGPQRAR